MTIVNHLSPLELFENSGHGLSKGHSWPRRRVSPGKKQNPQSFPVDIQNCHQNVKLWSFQTHSCFLPMGHLLSTMATLDARELGQEILKDHVGGAWVVHSVKHLPSSQIISQGPGIQSPVGLPAQQGVSFSLSLCSSPSPFASPPSPFCALSRSLSVF